MYKFLLMCLFLTSCVSSSEFHRDSSLDYQTHLYLYELNDCKYEYLRCEMFKFKDCDAKEQQCFDIAMRKWEEMTALIKKDYED